MKFRNVSPLGDLDIPGVGHVPYGEHFEAVGDAAEPFLDQPVNYVQVIQHKDGTESDAPPREPATKPEADAPSAGEPAVDEIPADDPVAVDTTKGDK